MPFLWDIATNLDDFFESSTQTLLGSWVLSQLELFLGTKLSCFPSHFQLTALQLAGGQCDEISGSTLGHTVMAEPCVSISAGINSLHAINPLAVAEPSEMLGSQFQVITIGRPLKCFKLQV